MKTLNRFLATLGLCGLMLLPTSSIGDVILLDNSRIISAEETLGKTQEEVRKEIGAPHSTGQCSMTTPIEGRPVVFMGTGWAYHAEITNGVASLSICFIKGYAVSEQRILGHMENGREEMTMVAVFDHRMLRKVLDGELDRPNWVDPDGPDI